MPPWCVNTAQIVTVKTGVRLQQSPVACGHHPSFTQGLWRHWTSTRVLDDDTAGTLQVSMHVHVPRLEVASYHYLVLLLVSATHNCKDRWQHFLLHSILWYNVSNNSMVNHLNIFMVLRVRSSLLLSGYHNKMWRYKNYEQQWISPDIFPCRHVHGKIKELHVYCNSYLIFLWLHRYDCSY